jgi:poly-gamma-glutamate synthesis protein (capsule biosynthesis protein)
MEWYAGKPIFYGLGHFVFDLREPAWPDWLGDTAARPAESESYDIYERPGWPLLPMHPDARLTMLAWVDVDEEGRPSVAGFLPCTLAPDGRVHPHDGRSDEGRRVLAYVERCCRTQNLATTLSIADDQSIAGLATVRIHDRAA